MCMLQCESLRKPRDPSFFLFFFFPGLLSSESINSILFKIALAMLGVSRNCLDIKVAKEPFLSKQGSNARRSGYLAGCYLSHFLNA